MNRETRRKYKLSNKVGNLTYGQIIALPYDEQIKIIHMFDSNWKMPSERNERNERNETKEEIKEEIKEEVKEDNKENHGNI
jgi:hypothetical protein